MHHRINLPILQVALDMTDIDTAVRIAREALGGGADWIECGTPLIKAIGIGAIKALRKEFPDVVIVADMKTMDAGALEAEMAFSSGANIVTVLGLASIETISNVVKVAKKNDGLVMVDMINHPDPINRATELREYNIDADIILLHVGIDQQCMSISHLEIIPSLKEKWGYLVAVAGGLNPQSSSSAIELGADIVIVGRYITLSSNVKQKAREVKSAIAKAWKESRAHK